MWRFSIGESTVIHFQVADDEPHIYLIISFEIGVVYLDSLYVFEVQSLAILTLGNIIDEADILTHVDVAERTCI